MRNSKEYCTKKQKNNSFYLTIFVVEVH